jgi:CBS domain-containing protein
MLREGISGLPVVEDDEVVGIITKTDLIRGIQ